MSFKACVQAVAKNVRNARQEQGLRQVDVAENAGINYRHYQEIEAARVNLSLSSLWRLARSLHRKVSDLVLGCDDPS